ncbi:MAG: hypothetical protein J6U01_10145 [Clostridia bacterium]|nr:hypothetical protein [Clostridia bacterium]
MGKSHERQYNLDLLKAVAIVCMVLCHPVITFATERVGYESEFWYFFADAVLLLIVSVLLARVYKSVKAKYQEHHVI